MNKLILLLLLGTTTVLAQTNDSLKLYVHTGIEVESQRVIQNHNSGSRTSTISQEVIESNHTQSLSELLAKNSLLYIKSLGQGAQATCSFRGTSANHTIVNWNGIAINSPTMGNFDFSQVPAFFTDGVAMNHGAGNLSEGSGALGGSVDLFNDYRPVKGAPKWQWLNEYGSNNTFTEGLGVRFTKGKLTSSTRAFYQQSDNNYRYINKVLTLEPFYERRKNAAYQQFGLLQEFYYELPNDGLITANIWYQYDNRELPQPITVYRTSKEEQRTENIRSFIRYKGKKGAHQWSTTTSVLNDHFFYSRSFDIGLGDTTNNNRGLSVITKGEYKYKGLDFVDLSITANYRWDNVHAGNFSNNNAQRHILTTALGGTWYLTDQLVADTKVMGEVNNGRTVTTYSVGIAYDLLPDFLQVKASNAYNYRFPSLNDNYWIPGGNRDLRPEKGFSYDASLIFTPQWGGVDWHFESTYYHMNISNWITWIPTGNGYIWEPCNFSKVLSQGAEVNASASKQWGITHHKILFNYAYSPSIDKSDQNSKVYDRQLPYIPLNKWNIRYTLKWKSLSATYSVAFTDVRFTSADESYRTNSYITHDAELGYCFNIMKKIEMKATLRANNLLDAYYENTKYYPMPLRTINGALLIGF